MSLMVFEPAIPATKLLQANTLHCTVTGMGSEYDWYHCVC